MDYNKPPPAPGAPPPPPPQYAQQQGEPIQPPPYGQQQREQVQVIPTSISLEAMVEYIARGVAIVTMFLALVIIGTSKQTKNEITMKFTEFSAFKYFLAANVIVLIYSIVSLLMTILIKSKDIMLRLSIVIADLVFVSFLLTANGAASAVSKQLNDKDDVFEVSYCDSYGRFCSQIKASIAMSMLAVVCYLGLILLALMTFAYKRN